MLTRLPFHLTALAIAVAMAIPEIACAQDAPNSANPETKSLSAVIVTGTRSSGRTEAESLSPIDMISPAELASSGASNLATALNSLLPSLDFPRPADNDGNDALRPATLRGLSPDQVLVLVDGKRWHTSSLINYNSGASRGSAPVDLNSIPMAAIDHVEVLRDGASAQYGSDAIAGVINIVLKHGSKNGNEISANIGQMSKGDGAQNGVDGSIGFDLGPSSGDGKSPGWVRFSANYQNEMNTNRSANTDRSTVMTITPNTLPKYGDADQSVFPYQRLGDPAVVTYQALVSFGYAFSPAVEAYGYFSPSRRDVTSNGNYRFYNNYRNVLAMYPQGFLPQIVNHTNDVNGVVGLRGTTDGGWHWDASADYGKNHLVFDVQHSLNTNLYHSLGYSPTYFYAGTFAVSQQLANLDMSKDFTVGFLPNAVTFAWGLEYRHETYDIRAGEPNSYYFNPNLGLACVSLPSGQHRLCPGGSQVFPGLTPDVAGSWGRHNEAAYVDFETNLSDKLSAGFAARYEDYSDFGSVWSGKISARYQATDALALRGTISNGFRAPSLAQENYEAINTTTINGQLSQVGTYRVSSPVAIALGAKPLAPEKSVNISVGAVWQPFEGFSSTLDLYQIRINNTILLSDDFSVNNVPGVDSAAFFVNGADTRTRGADWVNSYRMDLDHYGELTLTGSANFNKVSILRVNSAAYGIASQQGLTSQTPRNKFVFAGDWKVDAFGVAANLTRYGYTYARDDAPLKGDDLKFPARWLLNLSGSYRWNSCTFTVGADNLTNQYPRKVTAAMPYEDFADGLQYPTSSPFGFNGRYVYGKVNYKF